MDNFSILKDIVFSYIGVKGGVVNMCGECSFYGDWKMILDFWEVWVLGLI